MLELTDWETFEKIYVRKEAISSMRRLPASDTWYGEGTKEVGGRTRIDTATDTFLVRETPQEIMRIVEYRELYY